MGNPKKPPNKAKDAAATASPDVSRLFLSLDSTTQTVRRRNGWRRDAAIHRANLLALADPHAIQGPAGSSGGTERGGSPVEMVQGVVTPRRVRQAWIEWLAPHFPDGCLYVTGTYSDEYGFAHGLTHPRNVFKDVQRFLQSIGFEDEFIMGVEPHLFRDVLHWHGVLKMFANEQQREYLKALWGMERGFSRWLEVKDGCMSYVTKYALKGDTDCFEWRLSSE